VGIAAHTRASDPNIADDPSIDTAKRRDPGRGMTGSELMPTTTSRTTTSTTTSTATTSLRYTLEDSPIGSLLLVGNDQALHGLYMQDGRRPKQIESGWERSTSCFADVRAQLREYFAGERAAFDLALVMDGTPFERRVWSALTQIPYGETCSYGELARRLDQPSAARAVGLANGRNPIAVIVPCHRVIGADGTLTGYGGGLERKRILLELESGQARLT
jgi:methylated-DNA-[protein]-cysteine S-methyltransferase